MEKGQSQNQGDQGHGHGETPAAQSATSDNRDGDELVMLQKFLTDLPAWLDLAQLQKLLIGLSSRKNLNKIRTVFAEVPPGIIVSQINYCVGVLPMIKSLPAERVDKLLGKIPRGLKLREILEGLPQETVVAIQQILNSVPRIDMGMSQLQEMLDTIPPDVDPSQILQLLDKLPHWMDLSQIKTLLTALPPGTSMSQLQQALEGRPPVLDIPGILQSLKSGQSQNQEGQDQGLGEAPVPQPAIGESGGRDEIAMLQKILTDLPPSLDLPQIRQILEGLQSRENLNKIREVLANLPAMGIKQVSQVKASLMFLQMFVPGLPQGNLPAIQQMLDGFPPETDVSQLLQALDRLPLEIDPPQILQLLDKLPRGMDLSQIKTLLAALPPGISLTQIQQALAGLPPGLDLFKILKSLPPFIKSLKLNAVGIFLSGLPKESAAAIQQMITCFPPDTDLAQLQHILGMIPPMPAPPQTQQSTDIPGTDPPQTQQSTDNRGTDQSQTQQPTALHVADQPHTQQPTDTPGADPPQTQQPPDIPGMDLSQIETLMAKLPPGIGMAQIQQALAELPQGLDLPKILQNIPPWISLQKISELLKKIPPGIDLQKIQGYLDGLSSEPDSAMSRIKDMLAGLGKVDLSQIQKLLATLTTPGASLPESGHVDTEPKDTADAYSDPLNEIIDAAKKKAANCTDPRSDGMCTLILVDTSGSMAGDAMLETQTFINAFLDGLDVIQGKFNLKENVALGTFGHKVEIVQHLTCEHSRIRSDVGCLLAEGPSSMELGIVLPLGTFSLGCKAETNGQPLLPRVIIISDGFPSITPDQHDEAPASTDETKLLQDIVIELTESLINKVQFTVDCVPVGKDPQREFLTTLSTSTGGSLLQSSDGKRASRCYLNHYLAGQVKKDGGQESVNDAIIIYKRVVPDDTDAYLAGQVKKDGGQESVNDAIKRIVPDDTDAKYVLEIVNKKEQVQRPEKQHDVTLGDMQPEECMHLLNQMLGREPVEEKVGEPDPVQLLELIDEFAGAFEDPNAGGPGRGVVGSPIEVLKQRNDGGRIGMPANPMKMLKTRLDVGAGK